MNKMDSKTLRQLQQTELGILIDFDEYCKKHNLQYYLIGGALLGAEKYKSFIPWDDDIDVAMPRADYEALKELWLKENIKGHFLQHSSTDPNFARCIMKVRKDNTKIIEKNSANVKMHNGIYIDIFPIDYICDNHLKVIDKRAKKVRKLMSLRYIKSGYQGRYQNIKNLIKICLFWLPISYIDKKIDSICTCENHKETNCAILYLHNYSWRKQIHKKEVFGEGALCDFEGHKFNAPADTRAFLKKVFGENYTEDLPKEKQKNPHNYIEVAF